MLGALSLTVDHAVDLIFHPWVYRVPGTRSAIGVWSATLDVPGKGRYPLLLELDHEADHSREGDGGKLLEGPLTICVDGKPKTFAEAAYAPRGGVSWNGARLTLNLRSEPETEPLPRSFACRMAGTALTCEVRYRATKQDDASRRRAVAALRRDGLQAARAELTDEIVRQVEFQRSTAAQFRDLCAQSR